MVRSAIGVGAIVAILWCAHPCAGASAQDETRSRDRVQPFDLNKVRLLDGPCKTAQEANRRYLHALDENRLLHSFRVNAGLDAPGEPLGGWEAPDCEVRGHFVGHYLSACALMYASAGDEDLKQKADRMVAELAKCQKALGGEYLSAFPESFWDRLEAMERPPWAPYYTIHKIMAGLLDCHTLCGNEQALTVLKGMVSYFKKRTDKLSDAQMDRIFRVEFGGMSEVLHDLYAITKDPDHLALANRFDHASFLEPLMHKRDNLTGLHVNTHIPKLCGAARRWELTGEDTYRTAAEFFWDDVVNTRTYATGGTSYAEHWGEPGDLAQTLSWNTEESCTTYNMLKLTRYLFRWTGEPKYADYYERAYMNGILGTQNPETGMLIYYMPLATGGRKGYGTPNDSFWCCYGTGIESFSKLGDSIYFHDSDGIYVNLFVASTVEWAEKGVRLEQRTRFPEEEGTTITVGCEGPVEFTLHIHVPYWATEGVELKINGEPMDVDAKPTSFAAITRTWKDGDRVEVRMPMRLRVQPMPDDPETAAIMYGPLVLAGLTTDSRYFLADIDKPAAWIEPVAGKPLTFHTVGQSPDVTFVPLDRIVDEHYGVYWTVVKEGSPRHQKILADEEERRRLDARTIDRVIPNNHRSETDHNMQGEKTSSGAIGAGGWRHAWDEGWWSWDLAVEPDVPIALLCVYWGSDAPPRTFDIFVEGTKIATQSTNRDRPGELFRVQYPIPKELTEGKTKITVRFQAHKDNTAGGVFGCATLRPESSE
jgi:DUF1680 family protein